MFKPILRLLVVLVLSLLMPCMARPFYYPTFYRLIFRLSNFLSQRLGDMIRLNAISGTELTQIQTLQTDLQAILNNPNFPKYRELA